MKPHWKQVKSEFDLYPLCEENEKYTERMVYCTMPWKVNYSCFKHKPFVRANMACYLIRSKKKDTVVLFTLNKQIGSVGRYLLFLLNFFSTSTNESKILA